MKTANLCQRVAARFLIKDFEESHTSFFISDLIFVAKIVGLKSTFHNVRYK